MIMSATWRFVETNDGGIRVGKRFQEIASLVSALAQVVYLRLTAYRPQRRTRWRLARLGDHLLNDIGIEAFDRQHHTGSVCGIAEGLTLLIAPNDRH
jgi:uncharacterized protein YjiS (DUF1127 family)